MDDEERILEEFDGRIDHVDGDTSYVKLVSRLNGDVLYGEHPTSKFEELGVDEDFLCRTIQKGEWTRLEIEPVAEIELTDEDVREIKEKIERVFPNDSSGVIY